MPAPQRYCQPALTVVKSVPVRVNTSRGTKTLTECLRSTGSASVPPQRHHLRVGDVAVHAELPLGDSECGQLAPDPVHLRLAHLALGHADHHAFDQTTHDALLGLRRRVGGMPQAGQVLGEVLELRMLLGASSSASSRALASLSMREH